MGALVQVAGLLVAAMGALTARQPESFRRQLAWWEQGQRLRYAAAAKGLVGVVLVVGSPATRWPDVIWWLGLLLAVASGVGLLLGPAWFAGVTAWWQRQRTILIRAWGLATALGGVLLVWVSR